MIWEVIEQQHFINFRKVSALQACTLARLLPAHSHRWGKGGSGMDTNDWALP